MGTGADETPKMLSALGLVAPGSEISWAGKTHVARMPTKTWGSSLPWTQLFEVCLFYTLDRNMGTGNILSIVKGKAAQIR